MDVTLFSLRYLLSQKKCVSSRMNVVGQPSESFSWCVPKNNSTISDVLASLMTLNPGLPYFNEQVFESNLSAICYFAVDRTGSGCNDNANAWWENRQGEHGVVAEAGVKKEMKTRLRLLYYCRAEGHCVCLCHPVIDKNKTCNHASCTQQRWRQL